MISMERMRTGDVLVTCSEPSVVVPAVQLTLWAASPTR